MEEFDFGKENAIFFTVGRLRDLLAKYPDNTPVNVCGMPGVFQEDEDEGCVWLDTMDGGYDDDANWMKEPTSGDLEYIDF